MIMRNSFSVVICILILCFSIKPAATKPTTLLLIDTPPAIKFDEYGLISLLEEKRRLDKFVRALQDKLGATCHIIVYGQRDSDVDARIRRIKNYLVKKRAVNAYRITTDSAPCRKQAKTELWIIPPGAVSPPPSAFVDQMPCMATSDESGELVSCRRAQQALGADSP
jgi:hypothetical protein